MKNEFTLNSVCPDFEEWPDRWQIMPEDKKYGRELLIVFRPFCEALINSELTKRSIKNHLSYLWLLGGELIEIVNEDEKWRDRLALDLVMARVDIDGGPYSRHLGSESEIRSFDATCRKLYQFLVERESQVNAAPDGYDTSWDCVESEEGNLPKNEALMNKKEHEWQKRDWKKWVEENLSFPFTVVRKEDEDDAYFTDIAKHAPFRLGHKMTVLKISSNEDLYGIIVRVREGYRMGDVPLCDVEVSPKTDRNFWPVREYVVWFANR